MIEALHIELKGLRFYAYHGVLPQERIVGGEYTVDVDVRCSCVEGVETDRVEDTLNYASLYHIVEEEMAQPSNLLEHVAGRIGKRIFKTFAGAIAATISITKMNPPLGADSQGARVRLEMKK